MSLNQPDKTQIYSICQIVGFICQGVSVKWCIQIQHLYLFTLVTDVNELVIVNMTVDAIIYMYALKVQRGLLYLWQKRSAVLKDIVAAQSAIPVWQYLQTWMLLQFNTFTTWVHCSPQSLSFAYIEHLCSSHFNFKIFIAFL